MSLPIVVWPHGGPVEIAAELSRPRGAPLKIDVWRKVRHPPPALDHVLAVKGWHDPERGLYRVASPAALPGKVLTFVWHCRRPEGLETGFHIRIDIRQDGISVPGYPVVYAGFLPLQGRLAELRVCEPFVRAEVHVSTPAIDHNHAAP